HGLGGVEEGVAVGGVARRRRGRDAHLADTVAVHDLAVAAQGLEGAPDSGRVEGAGGVDALAEPRDLHEALVRPPLRVGDEGPGGSGPAVDRGERGAHDVTSSRWAATQRPTGSTPPARNHASWAWRHLTPRWVPPPPP